MNAAGELIVVAPEHPVEGGVTVKLSGAQSNGAVSVSEIAGDDAGPGIHSHPGFDEMFYVLRGTYEFTVAGSIIEAGDGAFLYIPRGAFHRFRSCGTNDGRLLTICVPGEPS